MKMPYKANTNLQVNFHTWLRTWFTILWFPPLWEGSAIFVSVNGLWPQQFPVTSLHTLHTMPESSNKTDAHSGWHSLLPFDAGTALH